MRPRSKTAPPVVQPEVSKAGDAAAPKVGVLALQGAFEAHERALRSIGCQPVLVRASGDFDKIEGLVLPGGESSVHLKLLDRFGLENALRTFVARMHPVL